MYLPILRGKQFELLALREFAKDIGTTGNIWPVIEPVAMGFKALETACETLSGNDFNFVIVCNPIVGNVKNPEHILKLISKTACLKGNGKLLLGLHSKRDGDLNFMFDLIDENGLSGRPLALLHNDIISPDYYKTILDRFPVPLNIIHEKIKSRRYKYVFPEPSRVTLEDVFITQQKNADYIKNEDEHFTDIHLIYEEEGFVGFADYLTIGEQFMDGGFLPYAVAIHLTYDAGESIRVRHFVSNSNDDNQDTPGKFAEALHKLVQFTKTLPYKTRAVKSFEELYRKEHYPGLGTIKKLSMLNHLELVNYLLSK